MKSIAENAAEIRRRIDAAAVRAGRGRGEITLVAAAKTQDADSVRAAVAAGVDAVGENRVQEMLKKRGENAYDGVPLHFIGHLQTNKVRDVAGRVDLIQSVDSVKLAQAVNGAAEKLGIKQDVLLEVKLGDEPNKTGFHPIEIHNVLKEITRFDYICVRGLMSIPPIVESDEKALENFRVLYKLYVDITTDLYDNRLKPILSMGMSDDFELAAACGATMVRVGSALFGERKKKV